MSDPLPSAGPLVGRRGVLRLLGIAALSAVAGCRSGKQRSTPQSPVPAATSSIGSRQPAVPPTPQPSQPARAQPTPSPLSADQLLAQRVAVAERALLAAYDAVAVAHPELAGRLAPFRADHAAHLHGLVSEAAPSSAPSSAPAANAPAASAPEVSAPPSGIAPASASPFAAGSPLAAVSSPASDTLLLHLADLERAAAAARLDDVAATSGSLARLVASIGGCEAAHAVLLVAGT